MKKKSPDKQLAALLSKFPPGVVAVALAARKKLRELLPDAKEIVSAGDGRVTIAFSPTEQSAHAVLTLAVYDGWVNLFFANGEKLADPQKLLRGRGNQTRNILLVNAAVLDRPEVQALLAEARMAAQNTNRDG